jgi:hypothetical protein
MPPHCDALDGPVVKAASLALERDDVEIVLPFVPMDGEPEVRQAFELVRAAREPAGAARAVADRLFFETVVRVHRAGEGAAFAGLKPAGLDHGPVIPLAERAIETGSGDDLARLLSDVLEHEVKTRLDHVLALKSRVREGLPAARAFTSAMLGFQVWANAAHAAMHADPHEAHAEYEAQAH